MLPTFLIVETRNHRIDHFSTQFYYHFPHCNSSHKVGVVRWQGNWFNRANNGIFTDLGAHVMSL